MPKYRVFELAKEFGATSKVILDILVRNNVTVKNHMSSVDEDGRQIVEKTFARKNDIPIAQTKLTAPLQERPPAHPISVKPAPIQAKPIAGPSVEQGKRPYIAGMQSISAPSSHQGKDFYKPKMTTDNRQNQNTSHLHNQNTVKEPKQQGQKPIGQQSRPSFHPKNQPMRQPFQGQQRSGEVEQQKPREYQQQQPGGQQRPYSSATLGKQQQPVVQQRPYSSSTPGKQQQPVVAYSSSTSGHQQRPVVQQRPYSLSTSRQQQRTEGQQRVPNDVNVQETKKNFHTVQPQQDTRSVENQPSNRFNNAPKQKKGKYQEKRFDRKENIDKGKTGKPPRAGAFIMPTTNTQKPTKVNIAETITVKDFAEAMKTGVNEVIKQLMLLGVLATINQEIDFDTATLVANEFGIEVALLPREQDPTEIPDIDDDPEKRVYRASVVTIMGHVDHGKTSLLDTIRKTNVTAREAGGITQHIGAYQVNYQGKKIVFLDTPGHEAFTSMRARGAQVTDIAILVVAADDGVMPQTIEAINHAKAANVPIIVAINKIDKANANPDRVKQQLSEYGLIPEDWGGQTIMVPVSAHKQIGLTDLLEMILLVAEMQDLKANPNIPAQGTIIEAELDKGRGPVATVLVQKGTLRVGDTILAGIAYGKVRAMINERGELLKKAGPSTPVEVLGLSDVPMAGDVLNATDEKTARSVSEKRTAKRRNEELQSGGKVSLDDIFRQIQDGKIKELNIVVKADVQGTIEALRQSLEGIKNEEVKVVVVHSGVGGINESDVMLASAANALIIGFNVRPDVNARKVAETEKVDIRMYRVIYDAINDVEAAIKGMLAPKYKEVIQGRVEIRQVITISKILIAGSYVLEGKITRVSKVRLLRDNIVIHEGELESLRRFKDDVKEVAAGYECGLTIEKFRDVKEGDIIEAYTMEEIKLN